MWVVKLGGSLFEGPFLRGWLDALTTYGGGRLAVVPGGGPFADQVRIAQKVWRFDNATGHYMAMLGMAQYGLMLVGLQPGLVPAAEEAAIALALREAKVPVWIPSHSVRLDVPRDWSVTSDSLAAWMAARLNATHLLLVKSVRLAERQIDASDLAHRGVIDKAFPALFARANYACRVYAADEYALLRRALVDGEPAGVNVVTSIV